MPLNRHEQALVEATVRAYGEQRVDDVVKGHLNKVERFSKIIGISSTIALIGFVIYAATWLPQQAASEAASRLRADSGESNVLQELWEKSGRIKERMEKTEKAVALTESVNMELIERRIGALDQIFKDAESTTVGILDEFREMQARLERIETEVGLFQIYSGTITVPSLPKVEASGSMNEKGVWYLNTNDQNLNYNVQVLTTLEKITEDRVHAIITPRNVNMPYMEIWTDIRKAGNNVEVLARIRSTSSYSARRTKMDWTVIVNK